MKLLDLACVGGVRRSRCCGWVVAMAGIGLVAGVSSAVWQDDETASDELREATPEGTGGSPYGAGEGGSRELLDWAELESEMLSGHVQLTSHERFTRAGEAYFDPSGRWIVFQAVEVPEEGEEPEPHFSMFVARVQRDDEMNITGIDEPIKISPPGSANTCGWFHPRTPWVVIYGSTMVPPNVEGAPGYQRGSGRYMWQFPNEMDIVRQSVQEIFDDLNSDLRVRFSLPAEQLSPRKLIEHPGYAAECAYDRGGLHIVFCAVDPESGDGDLYAFNTRTRVVTPLVMADGYDGGPFFSPDGQRITYRSDRRGDNMLQLFVADLAFDDAGNITGVEREYQLTDNQHVNWAPFWHPSGRFLVYATSEAGHDNYEVFAIPVPMIGTPRVDPSRARPIRISQASGFDGLPVFSNDGQWMMWTSQRGGPWDEAGVRPSSQLWVARFTPDARLQRMIDGAEREGQRLDSIAPTKP